MFFLGALVAFLLERRKPKVAEEFTLPVASGVVAGGSLMGVVLVFWANGGSILDKLFGSQPMAHWYEVFNGVHVTFGVVQGPQEVINDPQLQVNDIVVPLEGAGGKLTSTISSPIQVHGVAKVPARRAPALGEHNEEILKQLGFSATEIDGLRASGATPKAKERAA